MKTYFYFFLLIIIVSCKDGDITGNGLPIPQSTIAELKYQTGTGTSGNEVNNLLGYGYDAKGFCDTISAREKVLDLTGENNNILKDNPNSFYPSLISGNNFMEFTEKVNNPFITNYNPIAFVSHVKSLYKLAFNKDSIEPDYAFAYFSSTCLYSHYHLFTTVGNLKTTNSFENDVNTLTAKQLVSKYGTHVLTDVMIGSKVEVLYRCIGDAFSAEQGIYKRMNQFLGGAAGIIKINETSVAVAKNEELIYNTIGSKLKMCGVLYATDNNSENIGKNLYSAFGDNIKVQFMQIGKDGLIPLDELIKDSAKKLEVKNYIQKYLSSTSSIN